MEKQKLSEFIRTTVIEILQQDGVEPLQTINDDTILYGQDGVMDSMRLVELMLAIEDYCANNNVEFAWGDDSAMSQNRSAYRTIGALADFILQPSTSL